MHRTCIALETDLHRLVSPLHPHRLLSIACITHSNWHVHTCHGASCTCTHNTKWTYTTVKREPGASPRIPAPAEGFVLSSRLYTINLSTSFTPWPFTHQTSHHSHTRAVQHSYTHTSLSTNHSHMPSHFQILTTDDIMTT